MQGGLHQAIEAKRKGLQADPKKTRAHGFYYYQTLFKMFPEVGRHDRDWEEGRWEAEFLDAYAMSVIKILTNRKKIRKDLPDEHQTAGENRILWIMWRRSMKR